VVRGRVGFASYLDALREDTARLAVLADDDPAAAVPACPGWSVADLIDHVADVHARLAADVLAADPHRPGSPPAARRRGTDELESGAAHLAAALEAAGPEAAAWNWTGEDLTAGWVARRAAHETAVHRVDAERALGRSGALEPELSADGVEERIEVFLARPRTAGALPLPGTLCLVASDVEAAWVLEPGGGTLRWRRGRGPADAALVGTAGQLFLFSWNRLGPEELQLTGRGDVALALRGSGP